MKSTAIISVLAIVALGCDKQPATPTTPPAPKAAAVTMADIVKLSHADEWAVDRAEKSFAGGKLSGSMKVRNTESDKQADRFTVWGDANGNTHLDLLVFCNFPWSSGEKLQAFSTGSTFAFTGEVQSIDKSANGYVNVTLTNCTTP